MSTATRTLEMDTTSSPEASSGRADAARRPLLVATIGLWSAAWGLLTARAIADGSEFLSTGTALRLVMALLGCVLCFGIQHLLRLVRFRRFSMRILAGAVLAAVAAEILAWANVTTGWWFLGVTAAPSPGTTVLILGFYTWIFFSWVTLYLALSYSSMVADAERRAASATAEAASAQLRALRYQLNPHFLFNTLNSLSALILEKRTGDAERMVVRLSSFLRSSLATESVGMVTAEDEVEAQRRYLEIEQVRFPDLILSTTVHPSVAHAPVPPMILQPLVENAIKFAISDAPGPAEIAISAERQGASVRIEVRDSGPGPAASATGMGVGLRNVRERLQTIYGNAASLEAKALAGGGFIASIVLPVGGD